MSYKPINLIKEILLQINEATIDSDTSAGNNLEIKQWPSSSTS